jgi:hypothetical protein
MIPSNAYQLEYCESVMNPIRKFLRGLGGAPSKIDERRRLYQLGRDGYKYCDGDHCVLLQIEMLKGRPNRLVYSATVTRWLPSHDAMSLTKLNGRRLRNAFAGSWKERATR